MLTTTFFAALPALLILQYYIPKLQSVVASLTVAFICSALIFLPSTLIIFRILRILYPGRVGVLKMSEIAVAVASASIFLPGENMTLLQWIGAGTSVLAGCFEVQGPINEVTKTFN